MASPCIHWYPVPARVVVRPLTGSKRRSAWFTVSATTTEPSGSSARPCGSLKRERTEVLSVSPRLPWPIRRTTVSPSPSSSTS